VADPSTAAVLVSLTAEATRQSVFDDERAEVLEVLRGRDRREEQRQRQQRQERTMLQVKKNQALVETQRLLDLAAAQARGEAVHMDADMAAKVQEFRPQLR
jgi:lipopolysaccharide export system protein LptC